MINPNYIIRNYRPADFDNYVQLIIEAEKLEPIGRCTSARFLSEDMRQPNSPPEQNLFVSETDGKIVGFMYVTPEQHIRRVILDCLVHSEHHRRGLAAKLLDYATHRAKELRAKVAHVNIREDNAVAKTVLSRLGFKLVRRFLELRLELSEAYQPDATHHGYQCHHLKRGEEDKLAQIQNRCFTGTWGYNPNTTEEIVHRLNLSKCSPEDVTLICGGDKPIGYCWVMINHETEVANSERKGRIYMLGVNPDFRGRGIGKTALLAGLSRLETKGIQVAELTVDSENGAACALYRSMGFKVLTSSLWYEKAID